MANLANKSFRSRTKGRDALSIDAGCADFLVPRATLPALTAFGVAWSEGCTSPLVLQLSDLPHHLEAGRNDHGPVLERHRHARRWRRGSDMMADDGYDADTALAVQVLGGGGRRVVTINRPAAELFAYFRDFSNLASFMENIV
eukprot:gene25292-33009_t